MTSTPNQGGQATVEFVLTLPLVILALLLVIQVGLVANAQVLVVNAAREGARAAAVDGTVASAEQAARASPGLRPDRVEVEASVEANEGGTASVQVSYRMPTDAAIVGRLLGDPRLSAQVTMRVESVAGS